MSSPEINAIEGAAPEATDFANYFCTYAYLYHQKDMLEDHKRTGAYYQAVMSNRRQFQGKVVLDVGTGSGILALFAAKAGARKVYAVEATDMAVQARKLIAHNKMSDTIEVIQGTIESIELPEKVDIIISEWMGYFLLRESMLDSVLVARDKFLKPGGAMYPSHATMLLAPIRARAAQQKVQDLENSMEGWSEFIEDMRSYYQVDLAGLSDDYKKEQEQFFLHNGQWTDTHPQQMLGSGSVFKKYDLHTLTLEELKALLEEDFRMHVSDDGPVEAFCGYFDVFFKGSEENPTDNEIKLSTAPDPTGATHWGQQTFYIHPAIECASGDSLKCTIEVGRQKENHRLLNVRLHAKLEGDSELALQAKDSQPRMFTFNIE
eukprot:gene31985-33911_t